MCNNENADDESAFSYFNFCYIIKAMKMYKKGKKRANKKLLLIFYTLSAFTTLRNYEKRSFEFSYRFPFDIYVSLKHHKASFPRRFEKILIKISFVKFIF